MPKRLASSDRNCQSYYIGDIDDDDGSSGDNAGAGEDLSWEAASKVGPVALSLETDLGPSVCRAICG